MRVPDNMKIITIKLSKLGNRLSEFSIQDSIGNLLIPTISRSNLLNGVSLSVEDEVRFIIINSIGKNCCNKQLKVRITEITNPELAFFKTEITNTSTLWKHPNNNINFNSYYGCISPYIIEYPFAYQYQDEILQNVQDYSKTFIYTNTPYILDNTRKIQTADYFNKAIIYNDQQSSGILELNPKPINNMKEYISYPKYNNSSKSIIFTKSDNFYQYNTFWSIVKNPLIPLFTQSCESLSIDKEVNQSNMDYTSRVYKKSTIRAKDVKVRNILDNRSDLNIISQFVVQQSQISYK